MGDRQCGNEGPEGFRCILLAGHDEQHLSIDNREIWRGSPGKPVRWSDGPHLEAVHVTRENQKGVATLEETARRGPMKLGVGSAVGLTIPGLPVTGEVCTNCGGSNMIPEGRCSKCVECGTTTGCSG